jgi:hypothetical protein
VLPFPPKENGKGTDNSQLHSVRRSTFAKEKRHQALPVLLGEK